MNNGNPPGRPQQRRNDALPALRATRLLDQVRERVCYLHHYSLRTEESYRHWIRAFIQFHGFQRHPRELDGPAWCAYHAASATLPTPAHHGR